MSEELTRKGVAVIFYTLSAVFAFEGIREFFGAETDGIQVILLVGNACLSYFMAMVFAAPEPEPYDLMDVSDDPHALRDTLNYREKQDRGHHR